MPDIPRFDRSVDAAELAEAVRSQGCAIVERLIDAETCDRVAAELAPYIEATPTGADDFSGANTRRTGSLLARSPACIDIVAHPLVLDVADSVLWDKKTTFQLHLTQAISIGPGAESQYPHRDQWCFDFFPFPDDIEVELGTMWALDDFTEANGATRIVPGTHHLPEPVKISDVLAAQPLQAAEMPRGSVVIYTGSTVHGGGANTTDAWRTGINVDYVLGWLRQEENQYLATPIDVVRTFPESVQRLMGYSMGAYALGYVEGGVDPIIVLQEPGEAGGSGSPAGTTFAPVPRA